ncbi:MAG TPA: hypothetical protein VFU38_08770 [Candidatus Krumholzibacteria bacterium]|nr:hypothetical protein [Candidatus Krumholzibacteria bacterium]
MIKRIATPVLLYLMMAAFAVGWRVPASTPSGIVAPVNMTLANTTLFVSDQYTGVHVYDVADAAAPRAITTLALEGNRGTAVKDDIVYASEKNKLHVYRREGDTFTLVTTLEPSYDDDYNPGPWNEGVTSSSSSFACMCTTGESDMVAAPENSGGGSSYATFAVIDNFLYRVDYFSLVVYDIFKADEPKEISRRNFGFEIETIYPTEQLLFLGGTRGMYIFDRSDPISPKMIGAVEHFRACDPVVVSGSVAYVTLRSGNQCGDTRDVLLTVNIADPKNPFIAGQKDLATPFGLAVREPYLYVSTGHTGYTLFDVTRPTEPDVVSSWVDWPTKDFLWANDVLYVLGEDDLRIFDVTNPKTPVLLSVIENDPS